MHTSSACSIHTIWGPSFSRALSREGGGENLMMASNRTNFTSFLERTTPLSFLPQIALRQNHPRSNDAAARLTISGENRQQGCSTRQAPGCVKLGEKSRILSPTAGRRTQYFYLILTQPGARLSQRPHNIQNESYLNTIYCTIARAQNNSFSQHTHNDANRRQ